MQTNIFIKNLYKIIESYLMNTLYKIIFLVQKKNILKASTENLNINLEMLPQFKQLGYDKEDVYYLYNEYTKSSKSSIFEYIYLFYMKVWNKLNIKTLFLKNNSNQIFMILAICICLTTIFITETNKSNNNNKSVYYPKTIIKENSCKTTNPNNNGKSHKIASFTKNAYSSSRAYAIKNIDKNDNYTLYACNNCTYYGSFTKNAYSFRAYAMKNIDKNDNYTLYACNNCTYYGSFIKNAYSSRAYAMKNIDKNDNYALYTCNNCTYYGFFTRNSDKRAIPDLFYEVKYIYQHIKPKLIPRPENSSGIN
jgi:hypothetical protein